MSSWSVITHLVALLRQLGTPEFAECREWPLWPKRIGTFRRQPWPEGMRAVLGHCGVDLLDMLLAFRPGDRPSAKAVLYHPYMHPERLVLGGTVPREGASSVSGLRPWAGERHPWRILCGQMSPEVLDWIRGDAALKPGTPEWDQLHVSFQGGSRVFKTELDAKFILAGYLGQRPRSSSLCGLSLAAALPVPRLQAWFRAFVDANTDPVESNARRGPPTLETLCETHIYCRLRLYFLQVSAGFPMSAMRRGFALRASDSLPGCLRAFAEDGAAARAQAA